MGFGRIGTDNENRFGIMNIVVGIGHCPVAPGVCNTGNCGRMTDPRLMIDVVGAPERGKLAKQISLFIAEFC